MGNERTGSGDTSTERAPDGERPQPPRRAALRAVVTSPRFAQVVGLLCLAEALLFFAISALAHVAQPVGLLALLTILGASNVAVALRPAARRSPVR